MDKPLVSLCITCYNQARFIRESVQSAFDQTYDPLEIVICDDHSSDGTDKIIEEMIADYRAKGGRHEVIFKRNETNLYVMKNYEQAFRMAHGELLITGAGDDISMPNRAERIVDEWEKTGRKATCILHGWIVIDESGNDKYEDGPWPIGTLLGAATTYLKKVVSEFGDAPMDRTIYEDDLFSGRAMMYGDAIEIREPLIKYRVGTGETTCVGFLEHRKRVDRHVLRCCEIVDSELEAKKGSLSINHYEATRALEDWRKHRYGAEQMLVTGKTIITRFRGFRSMSPEYGWHDGMERKLQYLPLIFPSYLRRFVAFPFRVYYSLRRRLGVIKRRMLKQEV